MCHCQHAHCCCPRYWCGHCRRYTHSQHYHGAWVLPAVPWYPTPRPPVVVTYTSAHQRDRQTITALGGAR